MSRLVLFSESAIAADSLFVDLLSGARIDPERQTFASAESPEELLEIVADEGAEFVLLCGEQPLQLLRPDLSTRTACGRPFYWGENDLGALATVNPEALQRNGVWADSVKMHLDTLVRWAKRPEELLSIMPKSCTTCGEMNAPHIDGDLLPFCNKHK